jgi:hypothetical protein
VRTSDLQLLAIAWGAGAALALLAVARRRRPVGVVALMLALVLAVRLDRTHVHALPADSLDHLGPLLLPLVAAVVVAWSARRVPAGQHLVLLLAGASLVGVWVGVPETSAALLGFGVLAGVAVATVVRRVTISRWAGVVVALVPVAATVVGAVGNRHALIGGLLCSSTVVLLGARPPRGDVPLDALVTGIAVHLTSAVVAARHVAISRDWDGSAVWIIVTLALAAVSASLLRRGAEPHVGGGGEQV